MNKIKFSLIIGTLGRPECLDFCLDSLVNQSYKNLEVIIIDQSEDCKSKDIVNKYNCRLDIIYRHVDFVGLSKARNVGLELMSGNYFCLIDDDAFYPKNYFERLNEHIEKNSNYIYSGFIWDTLNDKEFASYNELKEGKSLSFRQIVRNCPSPALSFPTSVYKKIGYFDEKFGVGAKYGAGEETDYILRAYKNENYSVFYYKDLYVEHPAQSLDVNMVPSDKSYKYSYGIGALYRKMMIKKYGIEVFLLLCEEISKRIIKCVFDKKNAATNLVYFFKGLKSYYNKEEI